MFQHLRDWWDCPKDPNKKEDATEGAPKKRRSRWDATPAEVAATDAPKRSRWDQAPAVQDTPMQPIIMNAPGIMQEDKHNRYLSDEELDALLPSQGYAIVTPPPGYATMAPRKFAATSVTQIEGFHIQESSDAAALAAAAGLAPELPTEIPGVTFWSGAPLILIS